MNHLRNPHQREMAKDLQALARRHSLWQVWQDFLAMSACAISNSVDLLHREQREAEYLQIVGRYSPDEARQFSRLLAHLVNAMEHGISDVLGEVFMALELGNKWHGQFFTPFEVCRLMARMNLDGVRAAAGCSG